LGKRNSGKFTIQGNVTRGNEVGGNEIRVNEIRGIGPRGNENTEKIYPIQKSSLVLTTKKAKTKEVKHYKVKHKVEKFITWSNMVRF
jgi:hypothetical protein